MLTVLVALALGGAPARPAITFWTDAPSGHAEVWAMNEDGTGRTRLKEEAVSPTCGSSGLSQTRTHPRAAADVEHGFRSELVAGRNEDPLHPRRRRAHQVYAMNADGSAKTNLSRNRNDEWATSRR